MNKKTKIIATSALTIAMCASVVTGATFALFTSESNVNIAVTSGKVDLVASVDTASLKTYSAMPDVGGTLTDENGSKYSYVAQSYGAFANGGSATLSNENQTLTLTNITPGDKVELDILIANNSTVNIVYRTTLAPTEENNALYSRLEVESVDTVWTPWTASDTVRSKKVAISINLPLTIGNAYQGKEVEIMFTVEALQGNASLPVEVASQEVVTNGNNVVAEAATMEVIKAEDPTAPAAVTATIPQGVKLTSGTVIANVGEVDPSDVAREHGITIQNTDSSVAYDVDFGGIASDNTTPIAVSFFVGKNLDITGVYHKGNLMTEGTTDGTYTYNASLGYVTVYTTTFSPFTVVHKYSGGQGTSAFPYVVETEEQLRAIASSEENGIVYCQLANDIALTTYLEVSKNIVLDLNGKTISARGTAIINNGILTIKDNSGVGKVVSSGNVAVGAGNNSVTTIISGNFEGREGAVITGYATGSTINIQGGVFTATDNSVIAGNGKTRDGEANTINISGGTFNGGIITSGYVACGIYSPWKDNINVSGGTFNITGGAGIVARAGNVNATGGEFNVTGNTTGKVGDSRVVVPCAVFVFDSTANYPAMTKTSKISVSGGIFTSEVDCIKDLGNDNRVIVNGGTFSADPTEYVADGYKVVSAEDMYKVEVQKMAAAINGTEYATLEAAVAAVENGGTITLLKSTAGNGIKVPSNSNFTVDFAGYTYDIDGTTVGSTGTETNGFQLLKDSTITFKNGTLTSTKAIILIQNYCNLTLENMTIDAADSSVCRYVVSNNNGDVTITGNTNIYARDGYYAFDAYYWPSNGYTGGVRVTIDENMTGIISGKIEFADDGFDAEGAADPTKHNIVIKGGTFVVSTDDEFEFLLNKAGANAQINICIKDDITYDWGGNSYQNSKALLMQKKTIIGKTGNETITFKGYGSANPIKNVTLSNIKVADLTVGDNEGAWEHGYLEFENLTATNVEFIDVVQLNGTCVLEGCTFNGTNDMYAAWINSGNVTFNGCTFNGPRLLKMHEAYGSEVKSVTVDNCTFNGNSKKPGVVIGTMNADTTVTIKNSTFINCGAGDQGLYVYESDTDVSTFVFTSKNNTIK